MNVQRKKIEEINSGVQLKLMKKEFTKQSNGGTVNQVTSLASSLKIVKVLKLDSVLDAKPTVHVRF